MSKDGFRSIEIEPLNGFIDFLGSPKSACTTSLCSRLLEGEARLSLSKSVKVRHIVVKFKGCSRVCLENNVDVHTPLLPKLKVHLFSKTTTLPAGDHRFPWELEVPNIYPRSLELKRASVQYKVEISVAYGLHKTLTAEYPIVVRRHLLLCKELAPLIETKSYQNTLAGKFHFEIEAPRIICAEQGSIPLAVKYLSFANQRRVRSIRTQLVQVELYRCQSISKAEADLENYGKRNGNAKTRFAKYVKRLTPGLLHDVDGLSPWQEPLVLHHRMDQDASSAIESPLVSIYHQIEIVFQFGQKFEDIRAKIPTVLSSLGPHTATARSAQDDPVCPKYPFETAPHAEPQSVAVDKTIKHQPRPPPAFRLFSPVEDDDQGVQAEPEWVDQQSALLDVTRSSFHLTCEEKPLKRCVSAQDLHCNKLADTDGPPARSATPTLRREVRQKPLLRPLDIDLANGKKPKTKTLACLPLPPVISPPPPQAIKAKTRQAPPQPAAMPAHDMCPSASGSLPDPWFNLTDSDSDLVSICSDTSGSSQVAPSLSSSATGSSSYKSHYLHSRPPSPVFSNAPGLPATIPLRSQESIPVALVEESFVHSPGSSLYSSIPSSNLFSPGTSHALHQSSRPVWITRESSVIDPDEHAAQLAAEQQHRHYHHHHRHHHHHRDNDSVEAAAIKHHYSRAALPPLPKQPSRRRTVYYADDSDDEQIDPLPSITENSAILCTLHGYPAKPIVNTPKKPTSPPRLPRLSLGTAFGVSFGN
ncbi:hypothetical protein DFQ28_002913 [Apophysomyces sp. BC1034]|nr:hypothetical protein DFQ30_005289 [Apophysomyces sp. BC1015]KAG0179348.1 hypothetical protein DFQ29_002206 [Apophysomyces sp. BC1021]KAG0189783.1 hypothetical protein DFQ28_002913 [Apophysomyces sp. BC1034]